MPQRETFVPVMVNHHYVVPLTRCLRSKTGPSYKTPTKAATQKSQHRAGLLVGGLWDKRVRPNNNRISSRRLMLFTRGIASEQNSSLPHGYITIARAGYANKYQVNTTANMSCVLAIPPSDPENRGSQDHSDHYTTRIRFAPLRSLRSPENPTVFTAFVLTTSSPG